MAHYFDWLPTTREGQLAMAKVWLAVLDTKLAAWSIPQSVEDDFALLTSAAESALSLVKNESSRTSVTIARCNTAFDAMVAAMRDIKKRYFFVPPLTEADLVSLGLKIPDDTLTPSGTPSAQVTLETNLIGRHELALKIIYVTGDPNDAANKGYRIWYSVVAPGETPPRTPDDLHKSFFTKRRKSMITFEFDDSGKTAWFAVQVENDGEKGSWGPMVQALIP
ncbi:hypothetical protein FACS1894200_10220 [Spirochaetia bacterium]|nr:hypothetical protein FACS1894200_10220 [Spirochaetia bacterium]